MAAQFIVQDNVGGVANANAYVTLAAFKQYHDNRGNDYTTGGYTDPQLQTAVVRATQYLDNRFSFPGTLVTVDNVGASPLPAIGGITFTVQPLNSSIVIIGPKTYTFQAVLTNVDGNVKIGATLAASILNLANAINAAGGVPGTDYALATVANTQVATSTLLPPTATQLTVQALVPGVSANLIPTTTTIGGASWAMQTLSGGTSVIAQTTQWPRTQPNVFFGSGYGNFYSDAYGYGVSYPYVYSGQQDPTALPLGIPIPVQNATCEYALKALGVQLFVDVYAPSDTGGRLVKKQRDKIDVIESETEFAEISLSVNGNFVMPAFPLADLMLRRANLVLSTGRTLVR